MFINITIESGEHSRDIRIDSEQKIKEAISILRRSGKLPMGSTPDYLGSMINQKLVSAHKTFVEEGVYDGDKLSIV